MADDERGRDDESAVIPERPPAPAPGPRRSSSGPTAWYLLLRLSGLWAEILGSILLVGLLGWGLDRWWGTDPWLLVLGCLLGAFAGVYNAARQALALTREPAAAGPRSRRRYPRRDPSPPASDE